MDTGGSRWAGAVVSGVVGRRPNGGACRLTQGPSTERSALRSSTRTRSQRAGSPALYST